MTAIAIPLEHVLVLAGALFLVGFTGVLVRRNIIFLLMSLEIMLNACGLAFDRNNMVYEKEHLLVSGVGKYPGYSFWQVAGKTIEGKGKGEARNESSPVDVRSLLP